MSTEEASPARVGSATDTARRLDRTETRLDALESEVRSLSAAISRVEQNQGHAIELNKLRFDAIESGLKSVEAAFMAFVRRIDGMLDGTIETAQARQGRELVEDYQEWRRDVDSDRTKITTIGRVVVFLVGGQALLLLYYFVQAAQGAKP